MVMENSSCEMYTDNNGDVTVTIPKGTKWYHLENKGAGKITVVLPEGETVQVKPIEGNSYSDYLLNKIKEIHDLSIYGGPITLKKVHELCDKILGHEE